ncbi:vWA domain-containing protein [Nocardia sp. NPDC051756]|uniref:vWA domain-containing protein n=1 Tax=Nocardia sp. NPDC051756 TaxID=3154751 RepID=UPI00344A76B4
MTQYPVGPYLGKIQAGFGGVVILCIDVSGSMSGSPLESAVQGAKKFAEEAILAHYEVGVTLWNHSIAASIEPKRELSPVIRFLGGATSCGGTDINDALQAAHDLLRGRSAEIDRVVAIFGDGDLGDRDRAIVKAAAMRADDIRILTLGLGRESARALEEISTEVNEQPRTATVNTIAAEIAHLANGLRRR